MSFNTYHGHDFEGFWSQQLHSSWSFHWSSNFISLSNSSTHARPGRGQICLSKCLNLIDIYKPCYPSIGALHSSQMGSLFHKSGECHFNAKRVIEEYIKEFSITKTATSFNRSTPELFKLVHKVLIQACESFTVHNQVSGHLNSTAPCTEWNNLNFGSLESLKPGR